MKFKIGDIVKYVSHRYHDEQSNPLWGGKCGKIKGKIKSINFDKYAIDWDNSTHNGNYNDNDLELIKLDINCRELNKNLCLK